MPQVSEFGFEGSNHGMANSAGWHHGREKPVLGPLSVAMTDAKYEVVREFQFGITRRLEHATPWLPATRLVLLLIVPSGGEHGAQPPLVRPSMCDTQLQGQLQ